jgi:trimeric autotransporter adhesin
MAAGAVYVFARNGTSWMQEAYLKASNTGANNAFGSSVTQSGDTLVVSAEMLLAQSISSDSRLSNC